ncbi:lysophospholipid acyltransferase family protein [Brachybacterium nesterenkovii]|uniref:lysophospholipid acyltransferase family protein n=1 Tax=Brachybacterium nesterenkovii TaxID=47847 RepID=UPI00321A3190
MAGSDQRGATGDGTAARPPQPSLSSPARAQGFDLSDERLAVYRSRWRASVRWFIQRVVFRAVLNSAVTPSVEVHRRVRTIRGPFVLVSNHTSHVDGPLLAISLPWRQGRLLSTGAAADYFFRVWHRRTFVRWMLNAFPIDRDGSRKNSGTSRRLLRSGVPILVFPEGGRQQTGVMGSFKPGAAALAANVGVPLVPAAIIGGHEAMPKGRNWPKPGRPPVKVVFGEPLVAAPDESVTDFNDRIRAAVADLYDTHRDAVLGPRPAPAPDPHDRKAD